MTDGPVGGFRRYLPDWPEPIEWFIYSLLALAALFMFLGASELAAQGSLKDPPLRRAATGYGVDDLPRYNSLSWLPPVPAKKPEGSRNVYEEEPVTDDELVPEHRPDARRALLIKCASYYVLAGQADPTLYQDYRARGAAALREAQVPQGLTREQIKQLRTEENLFMTVFQEFVESPNSGVDLYDRYHEICERLVRPLLRE
jgi:hypothetical protein